MSTWVLFAGLPGTGKSTLARALAERLPAALLDKDRVRAALFPGPLTDYTPEQDDLCMAAMEQAAEYLTRHRRATLIFLDGRTFSTRAQIDHVLQAAERSGAGWRILHVTCEDSVAEQRLASNGSDHPAKNRDAGLYRAIKHRFEPIAQPHLEVDTTAGVDGQLAAVERYLAAVGEGG